MNKTIKWGDKAVVILNGVFYFLIKDNNYDDRWILQTMKQESIKSFSTKALDETIKSGKYTLFSPGFIEPEKEPEPKPLPAVEVKPVDALHVAYLKDENKGTALITSPTGNCQMASIAYFDHLDENVDDRKLQLKALFGGTNYPLTLIDVTKGQIQRVKDTFPKGSILVEQEYTNPNGTKMCIFVARTEAVK